MKVQPIVEPSQPGWLLDIDRQLDPDTAISKASSFDPPDNIHPDPAPAMPGTRLWPRVFPGL